MKFFMEILITAVYATLFPLVVWVVICDIYTTFLSFFGYGKAKRNYKIIEDQARILILIAACNEEKVLKSSIQNWENIDYDEDLYDIVVVNDNSTDGTKNICESMRMKHVNTDEKIFSREGVGKPAGIQYALRALGFEKIAKEYDLLMVLDADNHVDPWILKEVSSQWVGENKPEVIQTYLDSKNPNSSLLSRGYAVSYWITNRFFQLSKYRLGLANSIGGTGFAVRTDWLFENGGFCYKSLTEDLEMEIEIVKDNGRIVWNHFARVYDEKPDDFKVSIRQRTRWSQGHWYVAFHNFTPLVKRALKAKSKFWKYVDQILYLFSMGKGIMLLLLLVQVCLLVLNDLFFSHYLNYNRLLIFMTDFFLPTTWLRIVSTLYLMLVQVVYAMHKDGDKKHYFKTIISLFYMSTTYMYTQVCGFFKWRKQGTWVKTPHSHSKRL